MLPYILLADDDCSLCGSFAEELDRKVAYAEVKTVECGRSFLDYLASRNWDDLPSMILVKYDLPDAKAPDLLRELRSQSRYSGIPILVWSRADQQKEVEECKSLGVNTYLRQPAANAELEAVVLQIDNLLKAELSIV
jgi:DNA-binding response OmpR family regulator